MKSLFILLLMLIMTVQVGATDKLNDKVYSEKEFIDKVKDEVSQKVEEIKKKSVANLTKELLEREAELKKKVLGIEQENEQLKMSVKDFEKRVSEFDQKQKTIIGCLDENERKKVERVAKLVQMVSGMKPDKAAELLSVQDTEISVKLISQLKPDKAAKIFNLMNKETSARLQKQYLNMKK